MALKSAPYYWLECDNCGARMDDYMGEFSAMADQADAIDLAYDSDWTTDGEKDNCPNCPSIAKCEDCGKPAGDEHMDRDGLCQSCWDKQEAKS